MSEETTVDTIAEAAPAEAVASVDSAADSVASMVNAEDYSYVLDKYRADGRSDQDAAMEQAKAYGELQSKFGAFTGSPDEFGINLSEDIIESGFEMDKDHPLYEQAAEMAKELNMNQEGFDKMMGIYAMSQMADVDAHNEAIQEEFKSLGDNATQRVQNIDKWAQANLPNDMIEGFSEMAVSANAVKAMEQLISMTRSAPMAPDGVAAVAAVDGGKLREMQFALDSNGNRKMTTDPAYRKQVQEAYAQAYPGEHNEMVG